MKTIERNVSPLSEYFIYTPSKTAQKAFLYPTHLGIFVYEPGYRLVRSAFDSFLLMYIQKGELLLDFAKRQQRVTEKSFVLIDCYQPHGYSTEMGYEALWLHFDGVVARSYYELIASKLGPVFTLDDASVVLRKMNAILEVFFENKLVREPLLSKYLVDILTELMLYDPGNSHVCDHATIVERAITYIYEHSSEGISVEQLSSLSGLSTYYFIRLFKQETGYTPHEYIVNQRMASARYLLKYTSMTIKEICFNCGFSSESVFCNAFKKRYGRTPHQYRSRGIDSADPVD